MEERECYKCKIIKAKSEFYKREFIKPFRPICKGCDMYSYYKQNKPLEVYIKSMYNNQKSSARGRNMPIPDYTLEEFKEFLFKNDFEELYDRYLQQGRNKDIAPSVDRIDPRISYTMNNIQLMTWKENHIKMGKEDVLLLGKNVKVIHYDKQGSTKIYMGAFEASERLGISSGYIHNSCNYILRNYPNGIFRYYKPKEDKRKELSAKLVQLLKAKKTPDGNKGWCSPLQKEHLEILRKKHLEETLKRELEQGYSTKERLYRIWYSQTQGSNKAKEIQPEWKESYLNFKAWAISIGYTDEYNIVKSIKGIYTKETLSLKPIIKP